VTSAKTGNRFDLDYSIKGWFSSGLLLKNIFQVINPRPLAKPSDNSLLLLIETDSVRFGVYYQKKLMVIVGQNDGEARAPRRTKVMVFFPGHEVDLDKLLY